MKQHITAKQLNELSKKGKERLRDWQIEHSYWNKRKREGVEFETDIGISVVNLLSIGQMIEFLDERKTIKYLHRIKGEALTDFLTENVYVRFNTPHDEKKEFKVIAWEGKKLRKNLWQAVKEKLEKCTKKT